MARAKGSSLRLWRRKCRAKHPTESREGTGGDRHGGDGAAALFTAPLRPPLIASDDRPLVDMICFLQMGARLPSFSQPTPHACNASSADVDAARLLSKVNISPTPTTLRARGNYLHTTAHRLSGGAARLRCGYGTGGQSPQVHR